MAALAPPEGTGLLVSAALVAVVVTPVLSALVLQRYRRAVARSMGTGAGRPPIPLPEPPARLGGSRWAVPPRPVVLVGATAGGGGAAGRAVRRRMRSLASVHAVAGAVFGLLVASAVLWAHDLEFETQRLLVLAVLHAWPLVPTLVLVLAARRHARVLAGVGFLASVPLLTLGTRAPIGETLIQMGLSVVPPAVLLIALSGRNLRAVGPFLAVPVLVVAAGLLLWPWTAHLVVLAGGSGALAGTVAVVAAVMAGIVGFGYLAAIAGAYARKRTSDQDLLIAQWWFLATTWYSLLLLPAGVHAASGVWIGYVAHRIVLAVGLRLRRPSPDAPLRLLLLRTFGAQRRSELLLRGLGARWRHLGPVQMIAGADLAAATLEPHEFLDRLRGRLDRRFIGDTEQLHRRLWELDDRPDPDGRHRVNDLFCHDNAWRAGLHALLYRTDCALVDLRGFTPEHRGVAYELAQIVRLAPLDRVLLLADATTDHGFLLHVVTDASRQLPPGSPDGGGGRLRVLYVATASSLDPEALIGLLVAPVPPRLVPHPA
jgi:hypothetical protein